MDDGENFLEVKEKENLDNKNLSRSDLELSSEEEILKKSPYSKEASKIRLKMGIGGFSDKIKLYGVYLTLTILVFIPGLILAFFSIWLWIALVIITILIIIYFFFIHDFREKSLKQIKPNIRRRDISNNYDLLSLFESKEKIAREMIEKKFPSPQLTNTKFNGVLDNCHDVVQSQIEILNQITVTEKTLPEIVSRKKLINQVINKVDDLTNELILSEENNLNDVIEDMDNLINSVKEYD